MNNFRIVHLGKKKRKINNRTRDAKFSKEILVVSDQNSFTMESLILAQDER